MALETFQLALSVLKGEPDAHRILADILEEQGDRANAQFALGKKTNPRKCLDLAIGLVPVLTAIGLSCDFIEHLLVESNEFPYPDEALTQLGVIRRWTTDHERIGDDEDIEQICHAFQNVSVSGTSHGEGELIFQDIRSAFTASVFDAAKFVESTPSRLFDKASTTSIGANTRKVAREVRGAVARRAIFIFSRKKMEFEKELALQVNHTKLAIEELLQG